jgi:hypothetical protein
VRPLEQPEQAVHVAGDATKHDRARLGQLAGGSEDGADSGDVREPQVAEVEVPAKAPVLDTSSSPATASPHGSSVGLNVARGTVPSSAATAGCAAAMRAWVAGSTRCSSYWQSPMIPTSANARVTVSSQLVTASSDGIASTKSPISIATRSPG